MKRNGIVGAGNWILDCVKTIDRWPAEGELCHVLSEERAGGGGPCNVLFDLAALRIPGLPLYAAGAVGNDEAGNWLLAELARRGIDHRYLRRSRQTPTSTTDVMSGGGRRTFFHRTGANAELTAEELAAINVPAKFFYLGYLLLLERLDAPDPVYGTAAARLLEQLRSRGYRTAVDLVSASPHRFLRLVPPALPHTDILVINEVEAGHLLGRPLRDDRGGLRSELLPAAAARLLELGVRELAVIHFPEGAYAARPGGTDVCRPSRRIDRTEIVGANGAGDAFFAGLLYALHEDLPLADALDCAALEARFNLRSATASGGAPTLAELTAARREIPEYEIGLPPEMTGGCPPAIVISGKTP